MEQVEGQNAGHLQQSILVIEARDSVRFKDLPGSFWPFSACDHVELTGERPAARNQKAAVRAVKLRSAENDPEPPFALRAVMSAVSEAYKNNR